MVFISDPNRCAALFDIGFTLVTGPDWSPSKIIASIMGFPDQAEQVAHIIMRRNFKGPGEVCRALSEIGSLNPEQVSLIAELWRSQEEAAVAVPEAAAVVLAAKSRGMLIGLISDIWVPFYRSFYKACPEIIKATDHCALSFREGLRKPSKGLFKKALDLLKVGPGRAVMVGDTYEKDLLPAMEMGLKTVWLLCRPEREKEALNNVETGRWPEPDLVVGSAGELLKADLRRMIDENNESNPAYNGGLN